MGNDVAVSVKNLYKDFLLPHERKNSLKEWALHFKKPSYEKLHVLKDINLEIETGEFVGIAGRNGSGKSTLLKLIAGIYQPTRGKVQVTGTLTPFIELGIGFNPELTGRENIYLNGAILGLTRKQIKAKYQEIVDFAELEQFMDQKLKNYSSGMQVRLAFSIAIQAHNDILLIDEVLAVGDAAFQRKCFNTFKDIKNSNKTVIFVSHDMGAIKEYCDRAILIEKGKIIKSGRPDRVANAYLQLFNEPTVAANAADEDKRWGDFAAEISDIEISAETDFVNLSYRVTAHQDLDNPIFGVIIKDLNNHPLFDSNTKWKQLDTRIVKKNGVVQVSWKISNSFKTGRYKVSVAAAHQDGLGFYDWQDEAATFDITRPEETAGLVLLDDKITLKTLQG